MKPDVVVAVVKMAVVKMAVVTIKCHNDTLYFVIFYIPILLNNRPEI
jgi:hypothetical protein